MNTSSFDGMEIIWS